MSLALLSLLAFAALAGWALAGRYLPGEQAFTLYVVHHRLQALNLPAQILSLLGSINVVLPLWIAVLVTLLMLRRARPLLQLLPVPLGYPLYLLIKCVVVRAGPLESAYPWLHDLQVGYLFEGLVFKQIETLPPQGVTVPVVPAVAVVTTQTVTQVIQSGFISGHALLALLFYGPLAWCLLRVTRHSVARFLAAALVTLGLLSGSARIYMGVHFPSDVLGAWLLALPLLVLFDVTASAVHRRTFNIPNPERAMHRS